MGTKNALTPFGREVWAILLDKRMTVRELSERIGCPRTQMSMMIRGARPIGKYEKRIREALDMDKGA